MSVLLYLLNALLLAVLVWWLQSQYRFTEIKPYFFPALLLKLICGLLLGLLYHYYYTAGDTITYYKASLKLSAYAEHNFAAYLRLLFFNEFESDAFRATLPFTRHPGFSNSFFIIKWLSALNFFTNSSYWLNSLYFSLFSFWGTAKLTAVLSVLFPGTKRAAVVAFLFFPSVVFWSSGLLKDAVMIGSMCWIVAFILELAQNKPQSIGRWLLAFFMLYLFVRIKVFFSLALLLLLIGYLVVMVLAKYKPAFLKLPVQLLVILGFVTVPGLLAMQTIGFYKFDFVANQLVRTYTGLLAISKHGPHLTYPSLAPNLQSIVFYAPEAFFSSIFRPYLGESWQGLYILMGLENVLLAVLVVIAVISLIRNGLQNMNLLHLVLLLFILVAGTMIGLSTPNFGTLSRYRIIFLPFLVYLLLQNRIAQKLLAKL
ncbi:hypothetical protein [Pontibacter vulgaris]|uniref:hypothetical protein n=1 Tax=Pontibacter vulgaris TaxID=2905679 RepID=UPI001FA726CA|nr:hypothetical protein [Pontibacter vulgaris]